MDFPLLFQKRRVRGFQVSLEPVDELLSLQIQGFQGIHSFGFFHGLAGFFFQHAQRVFRVRKFLCQVRHRGAKRLRPRDSRNLGLRNIRRRFKPLRRGGGRRLRGFASPSREFQGFTQPRDFCLLGVQKRIGVCLRNLNSLRLLHGVAELFANKREGSLRLLRELLRRGGGGGRELGFGLLRGDELGLEIGGLRCQLSLLRLRGDNKRFRLSLLLDELGLEGLLFFLQSLALLDRLL